MGTSKIRADVKFGAEPKDDDWQRQANGYTVTLRYQGRRLTTEYWMGSAITQEPTAVDVFTSLLSDAALGEEDYSDFCADLGYDEDSRRAHSAWLAYAAVGAKLRRFLGDAYDALKDAGCDPWDFDTDPDGNVLVRRA